MKYDVDDLARRGDADLLAGLMAWAEDGADDEPPSTFSDSHSDLDPDLAFPYESFDHASFGEDEVGSQIGPYRLLSRLGEGAMGEVYLAREEGPLRRKVALKVIKPGLDGATVIRRFKAERQALAMMDHPNIARILDAGSVAGGRPYFAMEYVRGVSLRRFCDSRQYTPRQRLELFIPVCRGVHHAHRKQIAHRDLKPSNVLVTLTDEGIPVPKVIDFGLAKALSQDLTAQPLLTLEDGMVGTPAYMSPEQCEGGVMGADARGDIYSLGTMLYELLTGSTPLDHGLLADAGHSAAMRMIREQDPPRPSARVARLSEPSGTAAFGGGTAGALSRELAGDLDRIVMKCLEKDPAERYPTAGALADDIGRYLLDEAVRASPHSPAYLVRQFRRRHRQSLRLVVALGVLLLAAALVVGWQDFLVARARREALAVRENAERQWLLEKRKRVREDDDVSGFINALIRRVQPDPRGSGRDVPVAELLDNAAIEAEARLGSKPEAELSAWINLAEAYQNLAMDKPAKINFKRAYDLSCRLDAGKASMRTLGLAAKWSRYSDFDFALSTFDKSFRLLGERDPTTLEASDSLAMQLLARADQSPSRAGDAERAEGMLRKAVAWVEPGRPAALRRYAAHLAATLNARHEYADAVRVARDALERTKDDTVSRVAARGALGFQLLAALAALGDLREATEVAAATYEVDRDLIGRSHSATLRTFRLYVQLLGAAGRVDEGERLLETEVGMARHAFARKDDVLVSQLMTWGRFRLDTRRPAEALPLLIEAARIQQELHHDDSRDTNAASWLREALLVRAGSTEHASGTPGAQVICALAELWRDNPDSLPDPDTLSPSDIRFTFTRWNPPGREAATQGTLADPLDGISLAPGMYVLTLQTPVPGAAPLRRAMWVTIGDWDVSIGRGDYAGHFGPPDRVPDPPGPESVNTLMSGLAMLGDFRDTPPRVGDYTVTGADATFQLPAGPYRFLVSSVDGARVFVDGRRVVNAWSPHRPRRDFADLRLDEGFHHVRVENFQQGTRRYLRFALQPLDPAANAFLASLGGGPPRTFERALKEQDESGHFTANAVRGALLAQRCDYAKALAEYSEAIDLEPTEPLWWQQAALLSLAAGDAQGYARRRDLMLSRWGNDVDPLVRARCALVAAVVPSTGIAAPPIEPAASDSAEVRAVTRWAQGLASYRAGHYGPAAEALKEAASGPLTPAAKAAVGLVLAMASHQSGDIAQAAALLSTASAAEDVLGADVEFDACEVQDGLIYRLLRAEAAKTCGGTGAGPADSPGGGRAPAARP